MNVSPKVIVGNMLVNTVAFSGFSVPTGISGNGGHQQVRFLMVMLYGIGGVPHACTECTAGGMQRPCPEQGNPVIGATGSRNPYAIR